MPQDEANTMTPNPYDDYDRERAARAERILEVTRETRNKFLNAADELLAHNKELHEKLDNALREVEQLNHYVASLEASLSAAEEIKAANEVLSKNLSEIYDFVGDNSTEISAAFADLLRKQKESYRPDNIGHEVFDYDFACAEEGQAVLDFLLKYGNDKDLSVYFVQDSGTTNIGPSRTFVTVEANHTCDGEPCPLDQAYRLSEDEVEYLKSEARDAINELPSIQGIVFYTSDPVGEGAHSLTIPEDAVNQVVVEEPNSDDELNLEVEVTAMRVPTLPDDKFQFTRDSNINDFEIPFMEMGRDFLVLLSKITEGNPLCLILNGIKSRPAIGPGFAIIPGGHQCNNLNCKIRELLPHEVMILRAKAQQANDHAPKFTRTVGLQRASKLMEYLEKQSHILDDSGMKALMESMGAQLPPGVRRAADNLAEAISDSMPLMGGNIEKPHPVKDEASAIHHRHDSEPTDDALLSEDGPTPWPSQLDDEPDCELIPGTEDTQPL